MMNISTHWRYLALVSFLLTAYFTYAAGRHLDNETIVRIRQKRQQGAELYLPGAFVIPGGAEGAGWGPWGPPSPCSRTCGGGVSEQARTCEEAYSDGSPRCQGGDKKYFSCNTQDCPDDSLDFRSEQCSSYNSALFEGALYQWVPYTKATNPCELNCMPRGERFYYRHNTKVVDGTLCNDESFDVCVNGQCLSVGCDMMLGSSAREDKCRQCGGDGSSCKTTQGVFDKDDLTVGYNDLLLIPEGATNIVIEERRPSNNYLAIRNKQGVFYLNGNWRIDFPRAFTFAGAIWHYERKAQGFAAPDSIKCLGPTSEPVYLVMLYQGTNVGVNYEYSVPQGIAQSSDDEYAWVHDAFTHCSASCGGGYQLRNVTCASKRELTPVDDSLCDVALRPVTNQSCSNIACAARWMEGEWGECSAACGEGGVQSRQIYCHKIVTQGLQSVVSDDECFQLLGPKPAQHQKCNVGLPCPDWHVGPWNPCNKLCGEGKQRRNVRCFRKVDGKIEVLDDEQCSKEKPEKEKSCFIHPCDGVDWILSDWSGCDSCLSKVKTRTAHCATQKGEVFPSSFCASHPEPVLQAECDPALLPACDVQWYTSQWSKCSGKCGNGVQSRRVFCGMFNGEGLLKVASDRCDAAEQPEDTRPCELVKKDCPAEWHAGPWTECSKSCGGGERSRKVLCLRENRTVTITECEESTILDASEPCNKQACTEDEVLPVEVGSTQPVSDYEDEEWCDDEDYEDVTSAMDESATETSLDDLMMSDGPSYGPSGVTSEDEEGSGDYISTYFPETDTSMLGTLETGSGDDTSFPEGSTISASTDGSEGTSSSEDLVSGSTDILSSESSTESESSTQLLSKEDSTTDESSTDVSEIDSSTYSLSTDVSKIDSSTDVSSTDETSTDVSTDSSSKDISASTDSSSNDASSSDASSTDASSRDGSSSVTDSSSTDSSSTDDSSTESQSSSPVSSSSDTSSADDLTTDGSSTDASSTDASSADASSTEALSTDASSGDSSSTDASSTDASSTDASSSDTSSTDASSTDASSTDASSTDASSTDASSTDSSSTDASSTDASSSDASSSDIITDSSSTDATTDGPTTTELDESPQIGEFDSSDLKQPQVTTDDTSDSTEASSDITTEGSSVGSSDGSTDSSSDGSTDSSTDSSTGGSTDGSTDASTDTSIDASTDISTDISTDRSTDGSTDGSTDSSTDGSTDSSTDGSTDSSTDGLTDSSTDGLTDSSTDGSTESSSDTSSSSSDISTTDLYSSSTELGLTTDLSSTDEASSESSTDESSVSTEEQSTDESSTDSGESTSEITTESDSGYSTTEETSESSTSSWGWTLEQTIGKETSRKCKKRPKKPSCLKSQFGCCFDNKTAAAGPFEKGCPNPKTCKETKHGCCPDGVSPALGPDSKGCPILPCNETLFGCCSDKKTTALGNNQDGCPPPCKSSKFGCCADGKQEATGPKKKGCPESIVVTTIPPPTHCSSSKHGCCEDNSTVATGPNKEGCPCSTTQHGCCPDQEAAATGPNYEGCIFICSSSTFGCCPDRETPAHGHNGEGCCITQPYGCCPDNIVAARGPGFEGCGCQWSPYGCCPDNETAARGYNNEGCGCQHTPHGCCPNRYTPALGPKFEGCPCYTYQFGCCPDGKRVARGPRGQGCGCQDSEYGCCSDGQTQAQGPDKQGCDCSASKYGCCLDGITEASGEEFEGCVDKPVDMQAACQLEKDRGSCRNYTVKWYYDLVYGGCSRFWYGGCDGNNNRFKSQEECKDVCVQPLGRDICKLPKMKGPCEGYYPTWYYDTERKQCGQFIYGGCLGNNNRFQNREECQKQCEAVADEDVCTLETDPGQCYGNFTRWAFNVDSRSCQPFNWGGCEGNSNRFISESACIQQCDTPGKQKDMCLLPRSAGNCTEKIPKWFFDQEENRCMPFYYTGCEGNDNQFDTEAQCDQNCPKVIVQDTCTLPSLTGECAEYRERWFYDSAEKRCRQFYYGGCGGNNNNFPTEQECDVRCSEQQVTTTVQPEETYGPEICFLPVDSRPCEVTSRRWYYDSSDGVCKQFLFGNCQTRNHNNFAQREDCEAHCSSVQDLCQLPMAVGPCDGSVTQWFYDKHTDSCSQFAYGGCQGNNNRFNNKNECEQRCKQGPVETTVDPNAISPATQRPVEVLPAVCTEPMVPGNCGEQLSVWAYDVTTGRCTNFLYTGCGGNGNRFLSEEQCQRQCGQFRGLEVCRYTKDPGPCRGNFRKYYFEEARRQCLEYVWGGCDGGPNRFSSQSECHAVCEERRELPPDTSLETGQEICKQPADSGNCKGVYYRRWYFSADFQTCTAFIYTGCGGNSNNFKALEDCRRTCGDKTNEIDLDERFGKETEVTEEPEPPRQQIHPCKVYKEECATLRCPYGQTKAVQADGCERCACSDPCVDTRCQEDSQCVVEYARDRETGEIMFTAVCRLVNKPGECPADEMDENAISPEEERCERQCNTDADCSGEDKCCRRGCNIVCVAPQLEYQPAYTDAPAFTEVTQVPTESPHYPPGAEPPRIDETQTKPEVTAEEGNVATLRCVVYGNPTPTITWRKDSLIIDGTSGRHRILVDGALQIISLYRNDSGVYICVADNDVGPPVQQEIILQVNDPTPHQADVVPGESTVIGTLGSPLVLHCSAYGWPSPAVVWWQGETMLPIDSQHYERRRDYSLLIRSLQITQLGEYTCQAYNGIGKPGSWSVVVQAVRPVNVIDPIYEMYSRFLVRVHSDPVIVTPRPHRPAASPSPSPRPQEPSPVPVIPKEPERVQYTVPVLVNISTSQQSFAVGSDISLHCSVEGYPLPEVTWLKDGHPLSTGGRVDISESNRLTIYRVNTTDSGEYRCYARNLYSEAYSAVTINVEGVYIHPNCTDNPFFANCKLIVKGNYCGHKYYAKFCCRSCTVAGHLPSYGSHLEGKRK